MPPGRGPGDPGERRFRWLTRCAAPELFQGPLLYVTQIRNDQSEMLAKRFREVTPLAHIGRYRNGATYDEYMVYRVEGLSGDPLDYGT
jgi:hypothetical protein